MGNLSLSLAATEEIDFSFFSCGYLDVSVHRVRHIRLWIQRMSVRESRDQYSFDSSPELFAVFHALQRLQMPRHPPCALSSLTTLIQPSHLSLKHMRTHATAKPATESTKWLLLTSPLDSSRHELVEQRFILDRASPSPKISEENSAVDVAGRLLSAVRTGFPQECRQSP